MWPDTGLTKNILYMNEKWAEKEIRGTTPFRTARNNIISPSNSKQANERFLYQYLWVFKKGNCKRYQKMDRSPMLMDQ